MRLTVNCPAGELTHPVLSQNKADVLCRVAGNLRPAEGSPCCADYAQCKIWKTAKLNGWRGAKVVRQERGHVLAHGERDTVHVGF